MDGLEQIKRRSVRPFYCCGSHLHLLGSVLYFTALLTAACVFVGCKERLDADTLWLAALIIPCLLGGYIQIYYFSFFCVDFPLRKLGFATLSARYRKWLLWVRSGRLAAAVFLLLFILVSFLLTWLSVEIAEKIFVIVRSWRVPSYGYNGLAVLIIEFLINLPIAASPFILLLMAYHVAVACVMGAVSMAWLGVAGARPRIARRVEAVHDIS